MKGVGTGKKNKAFPKVWKNSFASRCVIKYIKTLKSL